MKMAQPSRKNRTNKCVPSFGDVVKYAAPIGRLFIPFGQANPVFIDVMSFNPWMTQDVTPTRTVDRDCSQRTPENFRTGTSKTTNYTKKQTVSSPGGQNRYSYTRLPSNDECPPSYDECVSPSYTPLTED